MDDRGVLMWRRGVDVGVAWRVQKVPWRPNPTGSAHPGGLGRVHSMCEKKEKARTFFTSQAARKSATTGNAFDSSTQLCW